MQLPAAPVHCIVQRAWPEPHVLSSLQLTDKARTLGNLVSMTRSAMNFGVFAFFAGLVTIATAFVW